MVRLPLNVIPIPIFNMIISTKGYIFKTNFISTRLLFADISFFYFFRTYQYL